MSEKFDYIISLGENCRTAMALRDLNLRSVAFPFDWHGVRDFSIAGEGGFSKKIDMICNHFERFFNRDDYEEFFETWETEHRLILNKHTGLQFLHEFPKEISISDYFPKFEIKYRKRIERLYSALNSDVSILFVFIEFFAHLTDEEIIACYQKLTKNFPISRIKFLIIKNQKNLDKEQIIQRELETNINIFEINNDFSQDYLKGFGNIGNQDLYKRIIWNFAKFGYMDTIFYNNIADIKKKFQNNFDYLGWKINEVIPQKIDEISARLPRYIKYANDWEKDFIKKYFCDFNIIKYKNDIVKLLEGLDEESAHNVQLVLSRLQRLIHNHYDSIDIFSTDEQEEIREISKHKDDILQLGDNLFFHKGCYLPINHFENLLFEKNLNLELYPKQVLSSVKGKDIIDVGAYIGDSAFILDQLKPKKIYAFEANPKNYDLLLKTIKLNHLDNVIAENLALGNKIEENVLIADDEACSYVIDNSSSEVPVQTCQMFTLDKYVSEHPEMNVGLIKVDIEGQEQNFLMGATETIKKFRPMLILSIYHNWSDFLHIKHQLEVLNLGYKFMISKPTSGAIILETELIAYSE